MDQNLHPFLIKSVKMTLLCILASLLCLLDHGETFQVSLPADIQSESDAVCFDQIQTQMYLSCVFRWQCVVLLDRKTCMLQSLWSTIKTNSDATVLYIVSLRVVTGKAKNTEGSFCNFGYISCPWCIFLIYFNQYNATMLNFLFNKQFKWVQTCKLEAVQ